MKSNKIAAKLTANSLSPAIRELALEGLTIAVFNNFDFFLDEDSDVCVRLKSTSCTEALPTFSVAFEFLIRYFAESKGIQLSDDEWIAQLIKIENFIESLDCDSEVRMNEVA